MGRAVRQFEKEVSFKLGKGVENVTSNGMGRAVLAVGVKGGMSLRNGMWHGLRNDIIMQNVKYGNWRKEIN